MRNSPTHLCNLPLRLVQIMNHVSFIYFLNFIVLVSCVILTLDTVSLDRKSTKAIVLRNLDAATTAVFGLEVSIRSFIAIFLLLA